jgi:hypothetical protein
MGPRQLRRGQVSIIFRSRYRAGYLLTPTMGMYGSFNSIIHLISAVILIRAHAHVDKTPPHVATQSKWHPAGPLEAFATGDATCKVANSWIDHVYCVPPRDEKHPILCSYANYIAGRSGVAIVNIPEIAATFGSFFEAEDPRWDTFRSHSRTSMSPPFAIAEINGKGKGLVANRTIKRYELIIADIPALLRLEEPSIAVEREDMANLLQLGMGKLPEDVQSQILSLSHNQRWSELPEAENIMQTNAFAVQIQGLQHGALFPLVSVCPPKIACRRFTTDDQAENQSCMSTKVGTCYVCVRRYLLTRRQFCNSFLGEHSHYGDHRYQRHPTRRRTLNQLYECGSSPKGS